MGTTVSNATSNTCLDLKRTEIRRDVNDMIKYLESQNYGELKSLDDETSKRR